MSETLYPHEKVIDAFKKPNSIWDSMGWLIFSYAIMLIQLFVTFSFIKINEDCNSTFVAYGLNICCYLTLILLFVGLIGFLQCLRRTQ